MIDGLAGWGVAFCLATGCAVVFGPRDARGTLSGAAAMTAFPGAWAATTLIGPGVFGGGEVGAAVVGVFLHGGLFALLSVLSMALQDEPGPSGPRPLDETPVSSPIQRPASAEPLRGPRTSPPPPPPRPRPRSSLPSIRPSGAVAAGAARGGGGRSSDAVERDGLLRVLAQGPDFQTSAAAKALAVAWEGTRDRRTLDGLIAVVRRVDVGAAARAEVWIAIRQVAGESLSWDEQEAAREGLPEGVDDEWLDALDAELHASG